MIDKAYQTQVYTPRFFEGRTLRDPLVKGNQKTALCLAGAINCCMIEDISFAAMMVGAVKDPKCEAWRFALGLGLLLNCQERLHLLVRFLGQHGSDSTCGRKLLDILCPNGFSQ